MSQWNSMMSQHVHKHNSDDQGASGSGGDNPPSQGE
jgi:hypothetical protein